MICISVAYNGVARGARVNIPPSDLKKKLAYVINCKVCFNSEKIHHNIPFQANEKKFNGIEGAGVQVGTISLIGTYGCPPH